MRCQPRIPGPSSKIKEESSREWLPCLALPSRIHEGSATTTLTVGEEFCIPCQPEKWFTAVETHRSRSQLGSPSSQPYPDGVFCRQFLEEGFSVHADPEPRTCHIPQDSPKPSRLAQGFHHTSSPPFASRKHASDITAIFPD
jgi:hypothetical protein